MAAVTAAARVSALHQKLLHFVANATWSFFFKYTATTEIYTLSLHDALPIFLQLRRDLADERSHGRVLPVCVHHGSGGLDRKSTRLNSSHLGISYAVFCLKKKKKKDDKIIVVIKKKKKKLQEP